MIAGHHLDMLAASGITPEHAAARGYETITDKRWLINPDLKITPAGRNVPGLLVPLLRTDGSTWGYQYKPDNPRLRGGKAGQVRDAMAAAQRPRHTARRRADAR